MERQKLPNSTAVLVLGILSIVLACCCSIFGSILGVIGLILANKAIAQYNESPEQYDGFNNVKTGKILNIIGIVLGVLFLLWTIFQIYSMGGWNAYMEDIQEQVRMIQGQ
ncbi:MAG: CCC motif membrane protein [Flavobacteriaceae bacterium]